jgi:hypothetical protein
VGFFIAAWSSSCSQRSTQGWRTVDGHLGMQELHHLWSPLRLPSPSSLRCARGGRSGSTWMWRFRRSGIVVEQVKCPLQTWLLRHRWHGHALYPPLASSPWPTSIRDPMHPVGRRTRRCVHHRASACPSQSPSFKASGAASSPPSTYFFCAPTLDLKMQWWSILSLPSSPFIFVCNLAWISD